MSTLSSAGIAYAKPDWQNEARQTDNALHSSELQSRWSQKRHFTIAEIGFGSGLNFIATVQRWLSNNPTGHLHYIGLESSPWKPDDVNQALSVHAGMSSLTSELLQQYPPPLRGWHRLRFPTWKVTLDLLFNDTNTAVSEITQPIDQWYLNGTTSPNIQLDKGHTQKNPIAPRTALVVGAGLAGSAVASALSKRGVTVTVIDALPEPASATSGNPVAALQGRYHRKQDHLGRWSQAASRHALAELSEFSAAEVDLQRCGSVHMLNDADQQRTLATQLQLPADVGEWLSSAEASKRAGTTIASPALWQAEACVVNPAKLTRARLTANANIKTICGHKVASLKYQNNQWLAVDDKGAEQVVADIAILATGSGTVDWLPWLPLQLARGQLTAVLTSATSPLSIIGYGGQLMPPRQGKVWLGATAARQPLNAEVLQTDHETNINRLATALPDLYRQLDCSAPTGRAAIRCKYLDHLPLAGEVSSTDAPGLYLTAAHGARGVSNSSLCGEIIAGLACGNPPPRSLMEAVTPSRAWLRQLKKSIVLATASPLDGTPIKVTCAE